MDQITVIARMKSDFPSKFGIPRQSGLVEELRSTIIFQPEFRNPDALRGIEGYSHLWLIWQFSQSVRTDWSPTVRPPRLGGNARMGVFATRSPFRPNALGLSCVRLLGVEHTQQFGTVLHVGGADLMDGTPIYDIKPYIPYGDCHPDAIGGFTDTAEDFLLDVRFPEELLQKLPPDKRSAALGVLSHDPRPSYQNAPGRVYGLGFAGFNIRFAVEGDVLTVLQVSAVHEMTLHPEPFEMIKSGQKTIELRLWDEKRQKIQVGDTILFTNTADGKKLQAAVIKLHRFHSFEGLYRSLPLLQCGYTEETLGSAQASDMDAYYPADRQAKYGVVGIELLLSE